MSSATNGVYVQPAIVAGRRREDIIVAGEIVRHRRSARLIHWAVALTFLICALSGMPIWTPIFGWMAYLVGGLEAARIIHPYAGVAFFIMCIFQFFHWVGDMRFTREERGWWRPSQLLAYMRWQDNPSYEGGKYNPGQKMFFFAVTLGAIGLLLSGIVMWFPLAFPHLLRQFSYLLHDITWIFFIVAIITHIYLGTAAEPGTFRSMTRGTVTRAWARLHHPGWLRKITYGEPRED